MGVRRGKAALVMPSPLAPRPPSRRHATMQQRSTIPPSTLDLYNALSAEVPHNGAAHPPGGLLVLCGEVYSPIVRRMRSRVSSGSRPECKDSPWRRRKHSDLAYDRAIL